MGYASDFIIGYIFFALLFFIIGVFITRWIFRIDKIVKLQEKQYAVFVLMARKMNVDKDELMAIEDPQGYWYEQERKRRAAEAEGK